MALEWGVAGASSLAHITGRAAIPAVTFFLAGTGAAFGASQLNSPPRTVRRRTMSVALGVFAGGCFVFATILPILLH